MFVCFRIFKMSEQVVSVHVVAIYKYLIYIVGGGGGRETFTHKFISKVHTVNKLVFFNYLVDDYLPTTMLIQV